MHNNLQAKKKVKLHYWPKPERADQVRGPNPKQKLLWIEKMPDSIRPHKHPFDIVLLIGGARAGKSISAVARALYVAHKYPRASIVVGSLNFSHLQDTIMEDYKKLLSIKRDWDHPFVFRGPNKNHKRIITSNGARIRFVNLDLHMRMLGSECDIVHIEEPEMLKSSEPLETLITRMSGTAVPFKQIILTANPENLDWMVPWFQLRQFEPGYDGPPLPIGRPCKCHTCSKCEEAGKEDVLFVEGLCPECGNKKFNDCPGNQYFTRVIQCNARDNDHLRDGYQRDLNATLSHDKRVRFSEGLVIHRTKGKVYTSFDPQTVLSKDIELDINQDLIWTLDFNQHPQCSVICQTYNKDGMKHVAALDEIILWGAGPEQVANEFIRRYKPLGLRGKVHIYGDPSGFNGAIKNLVVDRFTTVVEHLEAAGFDVILHARRTWFPIALRIDSVNWMMKDGNEFRRMKINSRCHNLIASAESVVWNPEGNKEDENCDRKARAKGRQGEVWPMTHPMCALGYYIVQEHPMVPHAAPTPYLMNADTGRVAEMVDGELIEYDLSAKETVTDEYGNERTVSSDALDYLEMEDELIEDEREEPGLKSLASEYGFFVR